MEWLAHQNHKYNGLPVNVPMSVGDRYYAQDMARDFWYFMNALGIHLSTVMQQKEGVISGCEIKQGATPATFWLSAGICMAMIPVDTANGGWPPTPPDVIEQVIEPQLFQVGNVGVPVEVPLSMFPGIVANGSTFNYLKARYVDNETGDIRVKARSGGSYNYLTTPSYTLTCDPSLPTSGDGEVVISTFIVDSGYSALAILAPTQITVEGKWDYIIDSNDKLDTLISMSQSNHTEPAYLRILVKRGNWQNGMDVISGLPSGTAINLSTLGCRYFYGEPGSNITFAFNDALTHSCIGYNGMRPNWGMMGVIENIDILTLNTSGGETIGFRNCANISKCRVKSMTAGAGGQNYGFSFCERVVDCLTTFEAGVSGSTYIGFNQCNDVTGCMVQYDSYGYNPAFTGFNACDGVANSRILSMHYMANSALSYGFTGCHNLTNCDIQFSGGMVFTAQGYSNCHRIANCNVLISSQAATESIGFSMCTQINGSTADITTNVTGGTSVGLKNCDLCNLCEVAFSGDATLSTGYRGCTNVSNSIGTGAGGDKNYDLVIDSEDGLKLWQKSTSCKKVFIKEGTYTLSSSYGGTPGIFFDLDTMGTLEIECEAFATINCVASFAGTLYGFWRASAPSFGNRQFIKNLTFSVTNTNNAAANSHAVGIHNCGNIENCDIIVNSNIATTVNSIGISSSTRINNTRSRAYADLTGGIGSGFSGCSYINNSYGLGSGTANKGYGFVNCDNIENCTGTAYGSFAYGFYTCLQLTNCKGDAIAATANAFLECKDIVNCSCAPMGPLSYPFKQCQRMSNCSVVMGNYTMYAGYKDCQDLVNCRGEYTGVSLQTAMFDTCYRLSHCVAVLSASSGAVLFGFKLCEVLDGCRATCDGGVSGAWGFGNCAQLTLCWAKATGNAANGAGFYTCIGVSNCRGTGLATPGAGLGYGFFGCTKTSLCKIADAACKSATYNTSYADAAAGNACADTAAGGYNS